MIGMSPLFSSNIKVDCPDGPRFILKHPEKAFAIAFPDWNVRIDSLVKFYSGSEVKLDPKVSKRTKSIVKDLTENYAALQAHYQAAYLGWWGNPCSKEAEKSYNDAKTIICEKEFALKDVESNTKKIVDSIKPELKAKPKAAKKSWKMPVRPNIEKRYRKKVTRPRKGTLPDERFLISESVLKNIQEIVSKLKV